MKKSIGSGRGSVYNIILKALISGDKYGYEICKEIEEKTNGSYILKQPSLYSGLKRLEAQGHVKSYWKDSALGGRRHYYSLTDAGKQRIENSNFNWQDARDGIVDNLFEKSELDKTIENMENDIDEIKSTSVFDEANSSTIQDVLNSTDYLVKTNEYEDEKLQTEDGNQDKLEPENNDDTDFEKDEDIHSQEENLNEKDVQNSEANYDDLFSMSSSGDDLFSMFNAPLSKDENDEAINDEEINNDENGNEINNAENVDNNENIEEAKETDITEQTEETESFGLYEEEFRKLIAEMPQGDIAQDYNDNDNAQQTDLFSYYDDEKLGKEELNYQKVNDDSTQNPNNQSEQHFEDIFDNLKTVFDEPTSKQPQNNEFNLEQNEQLEIEENQPQITDNNQFEYAENDSTKEPLEANEDEETNLSKTVFMRRNDENFVENYKNQKHTFGTYYDSCLNDEENQSEFKQFFSNEFEEKNDFEDKEQDLNEFAQNFDMNNSFQTNENNEITASNEKSENYESNVNEESNQSAKSQYNEQEKVTLDAQNSEVVEEKAQSNNDLDYKNIFGDLISNQDKNVEIDDEFVYNNSSNQSYNQVEPKQDYGYMSNELEKDNKSMQSSYQNASSISKLTDLPRDDESIKDINRTLKFDESKKNDEISSSSAFESYDQTPFKETNSFDYEKDPFEKYDTYQKLDESTQNSKLNENSTGRYTRNSGRMSFDKKYANAYNKFEVPDYEVRYFNKNYVDSTISRYISINKLNLAESFIMSLIICLVTTFALIYASLNTTLSGFQIFVYVASYLIAILMIWFNLIQFASNRRKKAQQIGSDTVFSTVCAIAVVVLTIAFNLFFGMNLENFINYFGSFVLPLVYSLLIVSNVPLKKFLSKFDGFYN